MPLANNMSRVADFSKVFGQEFFVECEAFGRVAVDRIRTKPISPRIATGQQTCASRSASMGRIRLARVHRNCRGLSFTKEFGLIRELFASSMNLELSEYGAIFRHREKKGRGLYFSVVPCHVRPSQISGQNEHNVRLL